MESRGKEEQICPKLKTHEENTIRAIHDKYLGDIISNDAKNDNNIKARVQKAQGTISNIMNILREISLGNFHFEIAVLLRETIFLSSLLLNSETWLNLTKTNIENLEDMDKLLLKRFFEVPTSAPTPSLYLELGCIPIRFLIRARRLMYLHYILNRDEKELVLKVFWPLDTKRIPNEK